MEGKSFKKLEKEDEEMYEHYYKEITKLQQKEKERYEKICQGQERITLQLDSKRRELEEHEKQVEHRLVDTRAESNHTHEKRKMLEKASREQKDADKNLLSLAKKHKKEKEKLRNIITKLEKRFDAKHQIELEVQRIKGALRVIKHIENEDIETKEKMERLREELKEKEKEMEDLEVFN